MHLDGNVHVIEFVVDGLPISPVGGNLRICNPSLLLLPLQFIGTQPPPPPPFQAPALSDPSFLLFSLGYPLSKTLVQVHVFPEPEF